MGGGFYDRALEFRRRRRHWPGPRLVGLAFDCQRTDATFAEPWDLRLIRWRRNPDLSTTREAPHEPLATEIGTGQLQHRCAGRAPKQTTAWDGVRNFQARNMLRDSMKKGDLVFFYHSSCEVPGIAGIVSIVKEGYPDKTAFDPKHHHYDADSGRMQLAGSWWM